MQESLLHYIWRFQKFSKRPLCSLEGKEIKLIHSGNPNPRGGPDFVAAQLYFDGLLWNGPVEVHLLASDWYRHGHHLDPQYDNVILHVVWQHDTDVTCPLGGKLPTLQLADFVSPETLLKHQEVFNKAPKFLACESAIHHFSIFQWEHYLDRLFVERMEKRIEEIQQLLSTFKNDWEAVLFVLLFKTFGLNSNGFAFFEAARHTPFHCVRKTARETHRNGSFVYGTGQYADYNSRRWVSQGSTTALHLFEKQILTFQHESQSSICSIATFKFSYNPLGATGSII